MFKNKLAIIAMAGMLAMCVGLTACGGNNASSSSSASSSTASSSSSSSSSSTASSSSSASSTAAAESASATDAVLYWEGALENGSIVDYSADMLNGIAALAVSNSDYSDVTAWFGTTKVSETGVVTLTDAETNHTINYTLNSVGADSMSIEIEGYGAVQLAPITESDFVAFVEKVAASPEGQKLQKEIKKEAKKLEKKLAKQAKKLTDEFNSLDDSTIFFWDGTLANGMAVDYMENAKGTKAFLSIVKTDLSDGAAWYGKVSTSEDGKITTITDSETGQAVAFEVVESVPETSMTIAIEGVGDVQLKPVTKADFVSFAEELAKLTD